MYFLRKLLKSRGIPLANVKEIVFIVHKKQQYAGYAINAHGIISFLGLWTRTAASWA
jgi:hypothetical protein